MKLVSRLATSVLLAAVAATGAAAAASAHTTVGVTVPTAHVDVSIGWPDAPSSR